MNRPQSQRLHFKNIQIDDIDILSQFLTDPVLTKYLPLERPYKKNEIDHYLNTRLAHWVNHHFGVYILVLKSTHRKIGYCGLEYVGGAENIDIRYGILSEYSRKGLIYEASNAMIEYGFDRLKIPIIYGAALPENRASIKILKKLGMKSTYDVDFYGDVVDYFSIRNSKG